MTKAAPLALVLVVILGGCGGGNEAPQSVSESPIIPGRVVIATPICPSPDLRAAPGSNVEPEPKRGPSTELKSNADLIWVRTDGVVAFELYIGQSRTPFMPPVTGRVVTVHGGPGRVGKVQGGVGLVWTENDSGDCGLYAARAFGMTEDEALAFADSLQPS